MKAIQLSSHGGPDVLQVVSVDKPNIKSTEVLVEVHYAGVNFKDTMVRKNQYVIPTPVPFIPGDEVAGIVTEVGSEVTGVEVGARVTTMGASSGYAEYVAVDEKAVIPIGETLDFATAAASPLQGLTAYHVLKTMGHLKEGETVLVHAAAGGVGSIAIQLAKLLGAGKVIATASTEEKLAYAKNLGADVCINYTKDDWDKEVLAATDGQGVDVALENIGGDIFDKTVQLLGDFGRMIVFGFASGVPGQLPAAQLIGRNQTLSGFFLESIVNFPDIMKAGVDELYSLIEDGKLEIQIGQTFPLEEAAKAHELIEGRGTKGKIILKVK